MTQPSQNTQPAPSNQEIDQWVEDFCSKVSSFLLPNDYQGTALYRFLIQMARAYHLPVQEVDAILGEGVKRGIEYIRRRQQPIEKPAAWLRSTCLNIMKNRVDANIKREKKAQKATEIAQDMPDPLETRELLEQFDFLELALAQLSASDQQLLRMKFWENKTYKQIQYHYKLMSENDTVPSVPALRKRESRALAKLRENFFSICQGAYKNS